VPVGANPRFPAKALGPRAQRMVLKIIEATREVFLSHGYSGTTIDEIARVAEVSRATFYTYFTSKREVLIALGELTAAECHAMVVQLDDHNSSLRLLRAWVGDYFEFLDVHGSFAFAWTQAAQEDEEVRVAGMRRHLALCRRLGKALGGNLKRPVADPASLGIVAFGVLERTWLYGQLYTDAIDRERLIRLVADSLWSTTRQSLSA
jgi:AcrR family transcriptional regulator